MTALESFNALDNREVSRKEVEQVLAQAKAENNTAIIYRLSRVLNDSPEATHFEITITHYDSSVGLSGVQHTGDYREALDDCGRLRKGWKFVKGNVVKVEEKPKKEAKPKKEKAPQKEGKNIENTVTFLHTERFKDDLSYDALERSYSWISFDPEKRAKREQQDWADSMEQLYNSHAEQAQQTGALEAYNAAFEKGYASLLKNYKEMISIRARTFSTAVTGGAGITARKIASNESLMQREYEKLKIHNQEVEKLKNKLAKIAKNTPADQYETGEVVKSVDVNAIAKLQDKIKQLEEKKEYIYRQQKAEKEYKKSKDSSVFEKYDIKKEDVEEMLDEINRYGYALYSSPANINAEIRRIRERITGLEKNQSKGEEEILIEGGKIVKNGATQRLQIFFDGIPDKDIREKLKRHAFKWAPSVKAWQRTLTPNAIWDVEHYLLATGILKKQGLSGVQHTGDYREALDDCGRLRKGWKFVKGNVIKVEKKEKPKKEAKRKKEKAPQKEETTKEVSDPKVKDFEAFDDLQAQLLAENADIPESEVLDFLYNFTDAFEEEKTVFRFWNTPGKKPTEAVLQYKKHPLLTRLQNPSAKMRAYELTPRGYELLEKFHKGVERIKKTYDLGYIAGIHKLYNFLRDRKAYTKKENVEDSSKKKVEKAPAKATKSLKSRKEKGENVANFTLLQEPTKVFLEFEDEKNQAYYKKSANKQGAVGADFLKKVIKDLKKQNLREDPRGFINTEDFPVSPTISKVTGIDSLKTVVVKDKNRPTLECVLIEADRYVATDLYNIILLNRSKNDGLKTGALYDPNYKCTKIGGCSKEDYYRILDYGFPNYKPILTENPVYTSDWVAIEPIIQHLKSGLEVIRKIYDWKRVYVVKITSNVGEGHYNLKYLLNDLQILQSNGAKKIRLYTNKLDEKLNIETDNGNIVVTMAVYIGDRSNYDVISPLRIAPVQLHFTQNRKEEKGLSGVDYSQGLFGAVSEVSTERFKTLKEAKRFFLKWALEHLRGKKIYHKELKKYVVFNRTGIEHSLSSKISYDKLKLITQAEKMLKESHLIGFEKEYKGRENIAGVYRMKATALLDEEKVGVILTLREGENGVIYYDHKIEEIERNAVPPREGRAQSFCGDSVSSKATSIPAPSVTERLRDSSLSGDKGTKKSLTRKKKDENFGLNASEAPVTSLPVPRQTLAQQLATRPEVRESFLVADEQMSLFLGALEKKTKDSLVITLTGKQGSGKTRFAFQFMNALAQRYRVGHASIEEHPESVLYEEKAYQYLNDTALEHITAQDVRSLEELDTMIRTNEVIVIDSFQKMRELAPHFEIDKDLRKKYDGKLFLVIFQQTADGKMRGGSKSQFDGDIILFTETFPDYRENYVYPDKNRYNKRPATELQYSIYEQRMLATAPEVPALPAHYEPTESEELNFEVL